MGWEIALAVVLVLANGFFVAVEFAVARLRPTQAHQFVRERRPGAKSALHAVEHIDAYLSACQLGITMSSLGLGALGEPAFHELLEPVFGDEARIVGFGLASVIAFAIITTLHVVLGELAPKSLAIARTAPLALALAPIMRGFYLLTKPIVDLFNGMGNLVLKPFGVPPASEAGHAPHSEEELLELLRQSSEGGLIEREERELSQAALVFGDMRAREVMHPRSEIDYVTVGDSVEEIARRAIETGRTRLPLVEPEGELEQAVGTINVKDLLPLVLDNVGQVDLERLVRPLAHVSESERVDEVLREMRRQRMHVALVHDEHGTVIGLVTMEDILEELVGEIEDEFDPEEQELIRERGGRLEVDGSASMRDVAERLRMDLDAHRETTVGGFLSEELGRVPEPGEVVELHGNRFEILGVEETRVAAVAIDLGSGDEA
jgi:magnesium and cobalt exporter, CNNM family